MGKKGWAWRVYLFHGAHGTVPGEDGVMLGLGAEVAQHERGRLGQEQRRRLGVDQLDEVTVVAPVECGWRIMLRV